MFTVYDFYVFYVFYDFYELPSSLIDELTKRLVTLFRIMNAWGGLIEDSPQSHRGHRGRCFFPGRETTAREKSLSLRQKLFSLTPTVDMKLPLYEIVPAGLRSFAWSPSPDRAKNIIPSVLSVSPWLINKSGYANLLSKAGGAKQIGVLTNWPIDRLTNLSPVAKVSLLSFSINFWD